MNKNENKTFFGYTIKEIIGLIATTILANFSKDFLFDLFLELTDYFPNIKAILILKINSNFFMLVIILIACFILTFKRNKRVRNLKKKKEIINIRKEYESKLKQYEFYPSSNIKYNYVIEKSVYDLTFYNKAEMKLIRSSFIKENTHNEFKFKYQWSGSDIMNIYLGESCKSRFKINLPNKLNKKTKNRNKKNHFNNSPENHAMSIVTGYPLGGTYTITPANGNFNEEEKIDVIFLLKDKNHDMETLLSMNVMRPTHELVFIVRFPKKLRIKNIRSERQSLFGDYKTEELSKEHYTLKEKTKPDGSKTYTITINKPQMLYCYAMKWDWN